MIEEIAFCFFSVCCIGMFFIAVFSKNTIYAMSALAGGMLFISGFFFLLDAEFLGVIQIIVYVGAVLVLYAFAIMLMNASNDVNETKPKAIIYILSILSLILLIFIIIVPFISNQISASKADEILSNLANTNSLGILLFTKYIFVFEICALMLLIAMICAIVLVNKKMIKDKK